MNSDRLISANLKLQRSNAVVVICAANRSFKLARDVITVGPKEKAITQSELEPVSECRDHAAASGIFQADARR